VMELALRNPFHVAIVSGVPGVGKTTVLGHVERLAQQHYPGKLLILNFGDFMLKAAQKEGLAEHRDQLRHLKHRQQVALQEVAARLIVEHASKELGPGDALIVDTHTVVKTPMGYWPGLPGHVVSILKPDLIILIEASPEAIAARRMRDEDKTRIRRDLGGVEDIAELMKYARITALASAVPAGSSVVWVENPEGRAEEAAKRIIELLKML